MIAWTTLIRGLYLYSNTILIENIYFVITKECLYRLQSLDLYYVIN